MPYFLQIRIIKEYLFSTEVKLKKCTYRTWCITEAQEITEIENHVRSKILLH